MGFGVAGREQRAAVLVGNDRDVEGAQPLGLRDDLLLVHADERAEHLHVRGIANHRHVVERLRRHLANHLARHQRLGAHVARNALGNPQHQPPVDHHPQVAGHAEGDLPLQLAEGHQVQPRAQLVLREHLGQQARLVLRGARQERLAVEVHQRGLAPAPHHAPGRHGRIDAAREQRHHASARAGGQAARARLLVDVAEHLAGDDLDRHHQLGALEVYRPPPRPVDAGAQLAGQHGRGRLELFVGAPHAHAKAGHVARRQRLDDGCGHALDVARHPPGHREVGEAKQAPQAGARLGGGGVGRQHDFQPPHGHANLAHAQPCQRRVHVAHEALDEPRPVPALEGQLLIVREDGSH